MCERENACACLFPPFSLSSSSSSAGQTHRLTARQTHRISAHPLTRPMDGLVRKELQDFVVRANDVIFMKLIRRESDVEDHEKDSFHPDFTHQIFGESENIFGYKDLKVLVYYTSASMKRFVSVSFREKIPAAISKGVEPDDILATIREHIPGPFCTNIDQFTGYLREESSFRPVGDKLNQFTPSKCAGNRVSCKRLCYLLSVSNGPSFCQVFEVYHSDMSVPGFRERHEQMQSWIMWLIDGASYIDIEDERWEFLSMYEKTGDQSSNGSSHLNGSSAHYHFVGYCTVYRYYAYPDKLRPRISQFLILPPFQRLGLGTHLLQSIYDRYRDQDTVVDIAVEDPAENFTKLRDFVDTRNCMSLPQFTSASLAKGWNQEMAVSAQKKLKVNRNQARRVYEILKLRNTDRSDDEAYRAYRLEVKNRLNAPFLKNKLSDIPITDEARVAALQKMYDQAEEEYLETIERLAASN